jgi:uncharacterized protein (TIGR02145 family)
MNHSFKIPVIVFLLISSTLCLTSCKKKDTIPTLTTVSVSGITQTSAVSGGNVTSDGGAEVTARGVSWGTSHNPTTSLDKTEDGTGTGAFTSNLAGLTANITYYVRAYATNSLGTSYGNEVSFSTSQVTLATLTTTAITSITSITAVSGGNITADGGGTIISRGVCWNTSSNPTTANNITTDGTGTGSFTSNLTNLQPGTAYYVRAYATNSAGTNYGNEQTFTSVAASTVPGAPTIGTATAGNAQATVTFTAPVNNGGSTITGYTVTSSPGNIIGTGSASPITVTGLTNGTAYTFTVTATNAIGTSVASSASNSVTPLLTDIDGNVYNIVTIGTQVWMAENLKTTKYNDGTPIPNTTDNTTWAALTTGAYSDYSNTPSNSTTYGRLYNWYVVDNNAATKVASNGGKNVCPTSWHMPTDAEWTTLTTYLGGESVAGGKLKETGTTHWTTPNTGATNETGFTALPGGGRNDYGTYVYIGDYGYWWSSTEGATTYARSRYVGYNISNVLSYNDFKQSGFSVRCVRDN